ncbi:MAG: DUF115 domain-containing protein, partial [bacterium]|nr:DUF115 domain-containing protein [bacterium]
CVDTALKPLLKRGIHPHFTITADPSYKNYLHLQGTEDDIQYFLVADTGVSTRVYDDFSSFLFSVSLGKPIVKMIEENIGTIGELGAWGSVISLAVSFGLYAGLDPVVFIGQDFAFTGMRNHCRGTSWEDRWLEQTRDLGLMQRKEKQSITGMAKVTEMQDIFGNKIMTSDRLLLYKNYLVNALSAIPDKRFINSSEGGVLTEFEYLPFQRVLEEFVYGCEPIDFSAVYNMPSFYNPQNKKRLIKFFKGKLSFFKSYRRKVEESLCKLEKVETLSGHSIRQVVEESEKIKDRLYGNVQHGELVEMWS